MLERKRRRLRKAALQAMDSAPTNTTTQIIKTTKTLPEVTVKANQKKKGGLAKASKGVVVKMNNKSVPDNTKVDTQNLNASSSGGVNANFKGVVKNATSKGSGKANTPPSKATPTAKYGKMMKKGGAVKRKKK
jgi:hypothetical protein